MLVAVGAIHTIVALVAVGVAVHAVGAIVTVVAIIAIAPAATLVTLVVIAVTATHTAATAIVVSTAVTVFVVFGLVATLIIVGIFLSDTYVALLGFLALTLALGAYAGVVDRLLSLLKLLIPLALIMLVLQLAFMRDGNMVWGFITDTGLITGSKACLRLLGVALPLILMLMVTKLNDLANACVEVLHVPYRYAFTFTTALRFVPVFGQEMNAIMEAQTARGVEYDTKNPVKKLKLMLPLCVPLLISSVGKTDATALAAEQRGFYLRTRASSYKRYPIKGLDIAALIVSIALIAIGFLF